MKRSTLLGTAAAAAVAATVVIAVSFAGAPRATRVKRGQPVPDVELAFAMPSPVGGRISSFRGQPTLLAFFETSTLPGLAFTRELQRIQGRFRARGLVVVGVSLDADRQPLLDLIRQDGFDFIVMHDPAGQRVSAAYGVPRPPEVYLIDREGVVTHVFPEGTQARSRELDEALAPLLQTR